MKEPIEFTDREQLIVSYYRDKDLPNRALDRVIFDGTCVALSVLFVVFYLKGDDLAWGFVGYGLLLWRIIWDLWRTRAYAGVFRSVLFKYDLKIRDLERQLAEKQSSGAASGSVGGQQSAP